jgi:hypothetical protein
MFAIADANPGAFHGEPLARETQMVANLETLSEAVDLATIDRKLADKIEADLTRINADITKRGFSEVTVDGKTYRISRKVAV